MVIKIVGIITLGVCCLGALVYLYLRADQREKQEDAARKHRLEVKKQNDAFTLGLFDKILRDQDDLVEALRGELRIKDDALAEQQRKIDLMNKNAEKLNLKEALNK